MIYLWLEITKLFYYCSFKENLKYFKIYCSERLGFVKFCNLIFKEKSWTFSTITAPPLLSLNSLQDMGWQTLRWVKMILIKQTWALEIWTEINSSSLLVKQIETDCKIRSRTTALHTLTAIHKLLSNKNWAQTLVRIVSNHHNSNRAFSKINQTTIKLQDALISEIAKAFQTSPLLWVRILTKVSVQEIQSVSTTTLSAIMHKILLKGKHRQETWMLKCKIHRVMVCQIQ